MTEPRAWYGDEHGLLARVRNTPVHWGTYLINFVFWVGIAHSGTLISAILHLFRAGWKQGLLRGLAHAHDHELGARWRWMAARGGETLLHFQ